MEEGESEESEEISPKKKEREERRKIHIENVLLPNAYSQRLQYFEFPKVGSFLAFEASQKTYFNEEALTAPR